MTDQEKLEFELDFFTKFNDMIEEGNRQTWERYNKRLGQRIKRAILKIFRICDI